MREKDLPPERESLNKKFDELDKELSVWKEVLQKENAMLEKMIASFEALEGKIKKKKELKSKKNGTP